jgi:AcrR family transcriptional regulator
MSSDASPTREKILDAGLALLQAQDGHGVRMADIARAAGVSRQAVYLHFDSRAGLLTAVARHLDTRLGADARLAASRAAPTGRDRIAAYVAAWAGYMPEIRPVAMALMAMGETDPEARAAWADRMDAMRQGCHAAIRDLHRDGDLRPEWTVETATDLFFVMLSIRSWVALTEGCGWTQRDYVARITAQALASFAR